MDRPTLMSVALSDWIDMDGDVGTTRQCELAGVSRATVYAHQKPKAVDADDLLLSRLIDEEYTRHPFYGTRRMVVIVSKAVGYRVNRKRVQRLMRQMGLPSSTLPARKWLIPLETEVKPQTTKQAWRGLMMLAVSTPGLQTRTFERARSPSIRSTFCPRWSRWFVDECV